MISSTPNLINFEPLPSQLSVIKHIRKADYDKGVHEVLLSGSIGSSKSLTLAHVAVTHCLMHVNANYMIGRLALPQLKATLCQKIKQHVHGINGLVVHYNETTGSFEFPTGSKITAVSWADKNFDKLGSFEFSAGSIEELVETKEADAYNKVLQRIGRLPHIKENFLLSATNPSGPSHWAYKHLIESPSERVKVFYSNTYDNPYLPRTYVDGLLERLDEKQVQRMIYGRWVEINQEVIYYAYQKERNFINSDYTVNAALPIRLLYDFNIGQGKPLSLVLAQYDQAKDEWHIFDEIIIEGQRTVQSLEEMESRGYFKKYNRYIIHGDASGNAKDTRSFGTDYEIIEKFLANVTPRIAFENRVPRRNPSIRDRHNCVNGYLQNALGKTKLFVYKNCPIVDEGFRLTMLKDRGQYLEDDSKHYQHCTTAIGYGVMYEAELLQRRSGGFGKSL